MKFRDIPAQETVKEQLKSMVDSNRIPHALLLEGPSGVGKFQLARALAQYIDCTDRRNGDSCGECPSCIQHRTLNQIDTHYVFPVLKKKSGGSSNPVSDDYFPEWKDFIESSPFMDFHKWLEALGNENGQPIIYVDESAELIRKLTFTAHASRYKKVLLWLPERMKEECANKLLKLIEEPHEDTLFILVSNDSEKILPTIYSRLRRIKVNRLSEETVSRYLQESVGVETAMADDIAHLSEGSILEAMRRIATDSASAFNLKQFVSLMRLAYMRDIIKLRAWAEDIATLSREKCMDFLEYCERFVGENFIFNLNRKELVYLSADEQNFSRNFARFITERNVMQLRKMFVDARRDVAGNTNVKMVMFDVAVRTILLIK